MAYKQNAGRENLRSSAIDLITDYEKKKPEVSKETKVDKNATVDGVTGTLKTLTTTTNTPGTTGKPFSSLPKNIQAEAREYRRKNPSTPSKTDVDVETRFTPNATELQSFGLSFSKPELTANLSNVQPLKNPTVTMAVSRGAGVNATGRRNASGLSGMGKMDSYTQDKKTMSSQKASRIQQNVKVANQELQDKYSEKNIITNLKRRGITNQTVIQNAINKGKNRINANTTTIDYYKRNN